MCVHMYIRAYIDLEAGLFKRKLVLAQNRQLKESWTDCEIQKKQAKTRMLP